MPMNLLSFTVGDELFAVDVNLIEKVNRSMVVTPVPAASDAVAGITNLKGKFVTVLNIIALLERTADRNKVYSGEGITVVVFKSFSDGNNQMGFAIDAPGELIKIPRDKILPVPLEADDLAKRHFSGVTETGNRLYRIIDINSIIERFGKNE